MPRKQAGKQRFRKKINKTNTTTPKQQPHTLWKKTLLALTTKYTWHTTYFICISNKTHSPYFFIFVFSESVIHNQVGLTDSRYVPSAEIHMSSTQIKTGKDLWEHTVPPSVKSRVLGYPRQCQTALDISSKGDFTPPRETYSNVDLFSWQEFFSYTQFLLSCASLYLHLLYKPSFKHLKIVTRLPSAFSSLGWKKSNSFTSPSSCIKSSNPLNALVATCWTFSSLPPVPEWHWDKGGSQYSRCGLTRAGEAITPPELFAMLLLMQPKAWFVLVAARVQCQLQRTNVVAWKL